MMVGIKVVGKKGTTWEGVVGTVLAYYNYGDEETFDISIESTGEEAGVMARFFQEVTQ